MKYLITFILLLISFLDCRTKNSTTVTQHKNPQEFYINLNPKKTAILSKNVDMPVHSARFIYQSQMVKNNILDEKLLLKNINRLIPDKNYNGLLILDWEGKAFNALQKRENKKEFEFNLNQFIAAIQYTKKQRPKAQVSFYGIPFRQFWKINDAWRQKNDALYPLYKEMDFLAPSQYQFYPDGVVLKSSIDNYIHQNVNYSLQIKDSLGLKVYPVVNHRFQGKNHLRQLISVEFFEEVAAKILNTSYNSHYVDGIIWWQSDVYSFNTRHKHKIYQKEFKDVTNIEDYQMNLYRSYLLNLKKYFPK